jgi:two-component system chemotaxis response regulator CheB
VETALQLQGSTEGELKVGVPSGLACPDCGGVLNEVHDGDLLRFRCRVGHAYAPETLYLQQHASLEGALWAALRALEETASLARRMAVRARELGQTKSAIRYDARAEAAEEQARTVREALRLGATPRSDGERLG